MLDKKPNSRFPTFMDLMPDASDLGNIIDPFKEHRDRFTYWQELKRKAEAEKQAELDRLAAEEAEKEQRRKDAQARADASLSTATKDKMEVVSNTISKLTSMFAENPNYTTYIRFEMNSFVVSSNSTDSKQNIIMSLEVKNNGSGYANAFTLNIAYAPSIDAMQNETAVTESQEGIGWGPNELETKLLAGCYKGSNLSSRFCTLQYGYGHREDLRSDVFLGIVTSYSCDMQEGMLVYSIQGFSSMLALNENKDPLSIQMTDEEKVDGVKPTRAVERLVKKYLQSTPVMKTSVGETGEVKIESTPISAGVNYDIKFLNDCLGTDAPTILTTQVDKNISQAISDILGKATLQEDHDLIKAGKNIHIMNKTRYNWYIDDTQCLDTEDPTITYQGTIYVYKLSPSDTKDAEASLVFNWAAPGGSEEANHIVETFKPEFKGDVLLSLASASFNPKKEKPKDDGNPEGDKQTPEIPEEKSAEEMKQILNGSYFMSNDGKLLTTEKSISPPIGGTHEAAAGSIEQEKASWLQDVQYTYKATMTTMGIPCPIPIIGKIRVVPLIYTIAHHSAGTYMVLGTTDHIDANGFHTTWDLMKYVDVGIDAENTQYGSEWKKDDNPDGNTDDQGNAAGNGQTHDPDFVGPMPDPPPVVDSSQLLGGEEAEFKPAPPLGGWNAEFKPAPEKKWWEFRK